jgi:hypothetical protein
MKEKMYTTELNYQNPEFKAGSVFSEAQWIAKGGSADGLQGHVNAGYITVWEGQQAPAAPVAAIEVSESPLTETADSAETETVDSAETEVIDVPSEDSVEEESEEVVESEQTEPEESEEVVEEDSDKPHGIWNFDKEDLDPVPLPALNTMYKDHAEKNGLSVRAYKDKEALIKKMCSEA